MAPVLALAAAVWLLPAGAAAQDRLSSAAFQMWLPSASLDREPLGTSGQRDLFRVGPTTYALRFDERLRFDPTLVSVVPWWAATPQVVYVPVIGPWGSDPRATPGAQTPSSPPAPAPPVPPSAPGTPKTFYVIPRCYAGDKPPERDALPPGCDVARLRTIPPRIP
jgi:hypothetical protein